MDLNDNCLVITGRIIFEDSPSRDPVDDVFVGKRNIRNRLSISKKNQITLSEWFRAKENGNFAHIKVMEFGSSGHLEYISTSRVQRMYALLHLSGIEIVNNDGSTRDVFDIVVEGVNHVAVVFNNLVGCEVAGKYG